MKERNETPIDFNEPFWLMQILSTLAKDVEQTGQTVVEFEV